MNALTILLAALTVLGAQQAAENFGDESPNHHQRSPIEGWTPALNIAAALRANMSDEVGFAVLAEPTTTAYAYLPTTDIAEALRTPIDGCWYSRPFSFESCGWSTVEERERWAADPLGALIHDSVAIVRGVVIGIEGGVFSPGGPGLMIQLEVTRWLKRAPDQQQVDVVHFFYPRGGFWIDETRICATAATDFPAPPTMGTDVLLFPERLSGQAGVLQMADLGSRLAFDTPHGAETTPALRSIPEFRTPEFAEMLRITRGAMRPDEDQR